MQEPEQERHSWIKLTVILLWLFLYGAATVASSSSETAFNVDNPATVAFLYIGQLIGVIILFILPTLLVTAFWTKKKIAYSGILNKPQFSSLLLGSLGIILALPLINWIAQINGEMHLPEAFQGIEEWMKQSESKAMELTELFTKGTSIGGLMLNLFVVAFMAALSEELFFRGLVQKVMIECFKNKHVAVWASAILFSAFHMQFFGFFPRMLMGAYLGYLFLWSGSLWPGIFAHFFNNGMAVFLIWLANKGIISSDVDKIGSMENQLLFVVLSFLLVTGCLFLYHKVSKPKTSPEVSNS